MADLPLPHLASLLFTLGLNKKAQFRFGGPAMTIEIKVPFHASEAELQSCLKLIIGIAKEMEEHGFTPEIREADRGGYWKWCHAEKSMNTLTLLISEARMHIAGLDHAKVYSS